MEGIKSYEDICISLKRAKIIVQANLAEYDYYSEILNKGIPVEFTQLRLDGLPKGSPNHITLDILVGKINMFEEIVYLQLKEVNRLENAKKSYEDFIVSLGGLKYLVAQLYYIEGMTLKQIAIELNYSYEHVRRISSQLLSEKDATMMLQ